MGTPGKDSLIVKKILNPGKSYVKFENGSKVTFHFQTRLCDSDRTLIDDSRKLGIKPMELILGKKFKLEVWEAIVQKMAVDEVAQFIVDKNLVTQYPFVSKVLRDSVRTDGAKKRSHCCVATLQNEGVGYQDLNNLLKKPSDLEFTIELLKVEAPSEYEKDYWQLSDDEKIKRVPLLREKGNEEFRNKKYAEAAELYAQAIGLIEQLMNKEKPHDEEWNNFQQMKIPLLLNYSQCKINLKEYYSVIEHCTTVLQTQPDNVKALFRRGKAHVGIWNPNEARADFERVMELDKSLTNIVQKEIALLNELIKKQNEVDKEKLKNMF